MKKLFFILVFMFSLSFLIAGTAPNPAVTKIVASNGKSYKVFANTAVITFKAGFGTDEKLTGELNNSGIIFISPVLTKESSVTYHLNDRNYLENHKNYDIPKALKCEKILMRTYVVKYSGTMLPDKFCKKLLDSHDIIESAKPYYADKLQAYVPNDPNLPDQQLKFDIIHAEDAWGITKGDSTVVIGISDGGVRQTHRDLAPNIALNTGEIPGDSIDNDGNGYIDDYNGYNLAAAEENYDYGNTFSSDNHGSMVTGLADAKTDNGIGIAGIGFNCKFFPIKISHGLELTYAYQSILYAAVRGCKVLNCSWGSVKPYDALDQVFIDYAVARDVAIVAAGGNTGDGDIYSDTFFPAGYSGVLAVGEVNNFDIRSSISDIGAPVAIMAPSQNIYSTSNQTDSAYQNENGGGTSFASPMVAGTVALVRSKFPNLNAIQALEQVRLTADPIYTKEISYPQLIPGRLNVYRAVSEDPFSKPGLFPINYIYYSNGGDTTKRFQSGDTIKLTIVLHNYLGSAEDLTFTLSNCFQSDYFKIINSVSHAASAVSGEDVEVTGFKIFVLTDSYDPAILRCDIDAKGGFHDFFKFNFTPSSHVQDFANDSLSFSMSDDGSFGFSANGLQGLGFQLKGYGNQLYSNSSLMVVNDSSMIMYGEHDSQNIETRSDFATIKGFFPPNSNVNILNDSRSSSRIGVQVQTEVMFDNNFSNAAKLKLTLTNVGNHPLHNAAIGYVFDFDLAGSYKSNFTGLLPSAIPDGLIGSGAAAAEFAQYSDTYPVFGAASYSPVNGALAQAAGLNTTVTNNFFPDDRIRSLTSGTSWQLTDTSDITIVSGIKFPGTIVQGDSVICYICIGGAADKVKLAENLKKCILSSTPVNVVDEPSLSFEGIKMYPLPADNYVNLIPLAPLVELNSAEIYDIRGSLISKTMSESGSLAIYTGDFPDGVYFVKIDLSGKAIFKTILVNH